MGERGYTDIRAMVGPPAPLDFAAHLWASFTVPSRRSRQGRRPDGLGWQYAGFWTKASNFRIVDRDQMKIVATGDYGFRVIN